MAENDAPRAKFRLGENRLYAGIPKVVGSVPTVVRHIFQLAWCGYSLGVTSPETLN